MIFTRKRTADSLTRELEQMREHLQQAEHQHRDAEASFQRRLGESLELREQAQLRARELAHRVDLLQQQLVEARQKPLKMLKGKMVFSILRALSKASPPLSARTAQRFARSAEKRDPGRDDFRSPGAVPAARQEAQYEELVAAWERIRAEQKDEIQALKAQLADGPVISVVVPVYNPDAVGVTAMVDSVLGQSYDRWELCIADDGSDAEIRAILAGLAQRDSRIRLVLREENGHISRATNSAIEVATGDYIALLDHDDLLDRDALLLVAQRIMQGPKPKIIYTDEDKIRPDGSRYDPHFKPDWNRDFLYGNNYVSHLGVYCAALVREVGGLRPGFEGAQDYDLLLRCVEKVQDSEIAHIAKVLYSWRATPGSTAASGEAKPYAAEAGRRALAEHLQRVHGRDIAVEAGPFPFTYRVNWPLDGQPLVSIIIPTRDRLDLLRVTVESLIAKTDYAAYEILIVDNGSTEPATLAWLDEVQRRDSRVRVLRDERPFNYSALNNAAVAQSRGEIIALLNNDLEIISARWLHEMVSLAVRPGTGCVGAKLYYPDGRIQHAGVVVGLGGVAGHGHLKYARGDNGYFWRLKLRQNYSAVTAACLVMRREIFDEVGGLNEADLVVAFNDVDLCLRVQAAGYHNVWTPWAELVHHESATRGAEDTPEKLARFKRECEYMQDRWNLPAFKDPAYNENLVLDSERFTFGPPVWRLPEAAGK